MGIQNILILMNFISIMFLVKMKILIYYLNVV